MAMVYKMPRHGAMSPDAKTRHGAKTLRPKDIAPQTHGT